jgi:hypothetical protein
MVVVPFLRNNPSAVMFFQRFIFPAKTLWEKYSERIWVFHCRQSIRKNPRVPVLALPSQMMVDLFQEISPRIARQLRF